MRPEWQVFVFNCWAGSEGRKINGHFYLGFAFVNPSAI